MANKTQQQQEPVFQELDSQYKASLVSGGEIFTFHLCQKPPRNGGTFYRFNRGNTGYTNIGIVKLGCQSRLQLVGFQTKDFITFSLRIYQRPYYKNFKEPQAVVDAFLGQLNRANPYGSITVTPGAIGSSLYKAYVWFFTEVKNYDLKNRTNFYDELKITDADFQKERNKNNTNMATVTGLTLTHISGGGTPPVSVKNIPLNQILYGPPGTGKTYNTVDKSLEILNPSACNNPRSQQILEFNNLKASGHIVFTTFHQSLSYEDFIEGIKPETDSNTKQLEYPVKPGIFKKLCERADKDNDNKYVLIIDEINRGNVSQIFGELITLIEPDKRLGNENELTTKLPYSQEEFGVPNNLYIIGTMNTADRSVEALDTALRRRFSFVEMMPNPSLLNTVTIQGLSVGLEDLLNVINQRIVLLKDREHQIGHSYFMKCKNLADLKVVFKDNIVPLLQEYFYGNYYNIGLVLGEEFVKKENPVGKFGKGFDYDGDAEPGWRMLTDDEWKKLDMNVAIMALMN